MRMTRGHINGLALVVLDVTSYEFYWLNDRLLMVRDWPYQVIHVVPSHHAPGNAIEQLLKRFASKDHTCQIIEYEDRDSFEEEVYEMYFKWDGPKP